MANTFKLKTDTGVTTAATIYTVGGSTTTVILGLILGNTTTSQVTATVTLENNDGDNVALVTNAPIPAGSSLEIISGSKIIMESSDILRVRSDPGSAVDVAVSYLEVSFIEAFFIAMTVATFKGSLVLCYFMHLISERQAIIWLLVTTLIAFLILLFIPLISLTDQVGGW